MAEQAAAAVEAKSELALSYAGKELLLDETVFLVGSKSGKKRSGPPIQDYVIVSGARASRVVRACAAHKNYYYSVRSPFAPQRAYTNLSSTRRRAHVCLYARV